MNHKKLLIPLVVFAALITLTVGAIGAAAQTGENPASPQAPLDNGFTYQGYLTDDGGSPITNTCDFRFRLYDALIGGTQVGADSEIIGVDVENGYFTTRLNIYGEFGDTAFNGSERFLGVATMCIGDDDYVSLGSRQRLSAVPYAIYAMNVPDHTHYGETVQGTGSPYALYVNNTNPTGIGLLVSGPGGDTGTAISAVGGIRSSADSTVFISPHSLVERGNSGCLSMTPQFNGSMMLTVDAGCSTPVSTPVSIFGSLLGSQLYIKSLEVCYKDNNENNFIDSTSVVKNDGAEGYEVFILDNTERGADTHTCYTVNADTPYQPVDNSTFANFYMFNMNPGGTGYDFYIYTIKLTLSEYED